MKKRILHTKWIFILLIWIIFVAILIYAERPVIHVFAEEVVENNELYEIIEEQIGALDLQDLQEYLHSLNAFSDQTVGERLIEYIKGVDFDYKSFGKYLLNFNQSFLKNKTEAGSCRKQRRQGN
jgi:hypothetical protein